MKKMILAAVLATTFAAPAMAFDASQAANKWQLNNGGVGVVTDTTGKMVVYMNKVGMSFYLGGSCPSYSNKTAESSITLNGVKSFVIISCTNSMVFYTAKKGPEQAIWQETFKKSNTVQVGKYTVTAKGFTAVHKKVTK